MSSITPRYITVVRAPSKVGKYVKLTPKGDSEVLEKQVLRPKGQCVAHTHRADDGAALQTLLETVAEDNTAYLIQGYFPGAEPEGDALVGEPFHVLPRQAIETATGGYYKSGWVELDGMRTISRSLENTRSGGWLYLDRDFNAGMPDALANMSDEEWLAALDTCCPGLAAAEFVRTGSTSGRVTLDGRVLDSASSHWWFRIADFDDYRAFGQRLKAQAALHSLSFQRAWGENVRPWYVFDPSVFSYEREVFEGKPSVSRQGTSKGRLGVVDPDISLHPGGVVDTSRCPELTAAECTKINTTYNVTFTREGGELTEVVTGSLKADTKIQTMEHGVMTPFEFLTSPHDKVRCQATFRESSSWNGFLAREGAGMFLFDNGTRTRYRLARDSLELLAARLERANAIALGPAAPEVGSAYDSLMKLVQQIPKVHREHMPQRTVNAEGVMAKVQPSTPLNVRWLLEAMGIQARLNMLTKSAELSTPFCTEPDELYDAFISLAYELGIQDRGNIDAAITSVTVKQAYHPFDDLLPEWDSVDRWPEILATVTPLDPAAWEMFLKIWLRQAVKAWTSWRSPVDVPLVLAFTGAQGIGKTQWVKRLWPGAVKDGITLNPKDKDSVAKACSAAVCELGELDATFKRADISELKAFLTHTHDEYRPPYGRKNLKYPRCTVFAGSVNDTDFLRDATGNRRFLPVAVAAMDYTHNVDMWQLFAQVKHELDSGELWYPDKDFQRLHAGVVDNHREISEAEEVFFTKFDEDRLERPLETWNHLTVTDLRRFLSLPELSHSEKRELTEAAKRLFGEKTQQAGHRGWRMPVDDRELNMNGLPKRYTWRRKPG